MEGECQRSADCACRLGASSIVLASLLVAGAALASPPQRLIDVIKAPWQERIIDGESKRVLPSFARGHQFPLANAPEKAHLRFSVGLDPEPARGRVRFDAVLVPKKGKRRVTIFQRELSAPGWTDADVDLSTYDLDGTTLVLSKTLIEGDRSRLNTAEWAEPMLVSGARDAAPSVILISLDTLRADHVGIYGYEHARTPALDALARHSVWYADAYSSSMWTVPSHRALLSGHFPGPSDVTPISTAGAPYWLAERFRNGGYLTAGFTGGGYLSARWGFATGFDSYYTFGQPNPQPKGPSKDCNRDRLDGPEVFERARQFVRKNAAYPFFLFVHTYDAHDRCPVWPKGVGPYDQWPDPGEQGRRRVIDFYDDMIAEVDGLVGSLLGELDSLGLAKQTIVAVTADHGEALWEHGSYGHGCLFKPYDPGVRVPLIVRSVSEPSHTGRIDQPVAAVDVAPTLLALAGLPPPTDMDGYLLPGLGLDSRAPSSPVYVSCNDKLAVRVGPHKLITAGETWGTEELYNLEDDPQEKHNVIASAGSIAAQLKAYAREYRARATGATGGSGTPPKELDDATRERLRSLGYIE